MNSRQIKKSLLKDGIIAIVVIALLGGGIYGLDMLNDSWTAEKSTIEGQLTFVTNDLNTRREKFKNVQDNLNLYNEAADKTSHGLLAIKRQVLHDSFDTFRARFYLNDLHVTMGALSQPPAPAPGKQDSGALINSEVSIDFTTFSDENVYDLIQAIEKELPGAAHITKCTITRQKGVTDDALHEIAEKGQSAMVKAEIKFQWYGIKSPEPTAPFNLKDYVKQNAAQ